MLLVVLCHACLVARPTDALTPYFEGVTPREPLTVDSPCPRGTEVRSHGELGATCGLPDGERPDDELQIELFKDGSLAGYATSTAGVPNGSHRTWHKTGGAHETTGYRAGKQHGRHVIRAWNGDVVLDENYVDGVRHGEYSTWARNESGVTQRREHGRYSRGLKTGPWVEWIDGRTVTGEYIDGKRDGEWEVREVGKPKPHADYYVQFEKDTPTRAEAMADSYVGLVGAVDGAWLALGLYGHYKGDNRMKIAGGIGLVMSAPLVHYLMQPARDRTKVVQNSWTVRPATVGGILVLYTIGKWIAGIDCSGDPYSSEEGSYSCESNFNKDYNWNRVAIVSAASIIAADLMHAVRRKVAPLERAWPQVAPMPIANGGGVALSGQF